MIHRRETDGKTEFQRRRSAKGIFFVCVCLERMGASYTARSVNLAWAAASSRLPSGCFPERAAQGRGTCGSLRHWPRGWWDGKMLGASRNWTCAGSMKPSGRTA